MAVISILESREGPFEDIDSLLPEHPAGARPVSNPGFRRAREFCISEPRLV